MSDVSEVKVVIVVKGERVIVGVKSPDCDPVMSSFEGGLPAALERVPALVDQAQQQWDSNPRYPKADLPAEPEPAKPAASRARQTSASPPAQPSWF
ncbi:hypothetical protein ES703_38440 [subsurface metagenome]